MIEFTVQPTNQNVRQIKMTLQVLTGARHCRTTHSYAAGPSACLPRWSPWPPCQRRWGWRSRSCGYSRKHVYRRNLFRYCCTFKKLWDLKETLKNRIGKIEKDVAWVLFPRMGKLPEKLHPLFSIIQLNRETSASFKLYTFKLFTVSRLSNKIFEKTMLDNLFGFFGVIYLFIFKYAKTHSTTIMQT